MELKVSGLTFKIKILAPARDQVVPYSNQLIEN